MDDRKKLLIFLWKVTNFACVLFILLLVCFYAVTQPERHLLELFAAGEGFLETTRSKKSGVAQMATASDRGFESRLRSGLVR